MKLKLVFVLLFILQISIAGTIKKPIISNKEIEIIIPTRGSSIEWQKTKSGKKAFFTVKGNSINLKQGEYITLFLKPQKGINWFRISNSVKINKNHSGVWTFNIEVDYNNKYRNAELIAAVTYSPVSEKEMSMRLIDSSHNILCRSQENFILNMK